MRRNPGKNTFLFKELEFLKEYILPTTFHEIILNKNHPVDEKRAVATFVKLVKKDLCQIARSLVML